MRHLTDPANKVYVLGMEGEFFELDVRTLQAHELGNICAETGLSDGHWPHFKAAYTAFGRVVAANNTYDLRDFEGPACGGSLSEWDGKRWKILEQTAFNDGNAAADYALEVDFLGVGEWQRYARFHVDGGVTFTTNSRRDSTPTGYAWSPPPTDWRPHNFFIRRHEAQNRSRREQRQIPTTAFSRACFADFSVQRRIFPSPLALPEC
jgi:hypothetical protein